MGSLISKKRLFGIALKSCVRVARYRAYACTSCIYVVLLLFKNLNMFSVSYKRVKRSYFILWITACILSP